MSPNAQSQEQLGNGDPGGATTIDRDIQLLQRRATQLGGVEQRGADDDGRAMLVIMEHWHFELQPEAALDLEAARRGDVFQVDGSKTGSDGPHMSHDIVWLARGQTDREGFDSSQ